MFVHAKLYVASFVELYIVIEISVCQIRISGQFYVGADSQIPPDSLAALPPGFKSWLEKCRHMWSSYFSVSKNG